MVTFRGLARVGSSAGAQIVSSVGSLALSLVIAHQVSAEEFGIFAIVFATAALVTGVARALTSEVLMFSPTTILHDSSKTLLSGATSASILMGLLVAIVGGLPTLLGGAGLQPYAILALGIPALIGQDHVRFCLIWQRRPAVALAIDVSYVIALVTVVVVVDQSTLNSLLLAWVACSYAAWVAGLLVLRTRLSPSAAMSWIRSEWGPGKFFLGDFLVTNILTLGSVYLISLFASVSEAGAVRAAQALLTPILLITRGMTIALSPEVRRLADDKAYGKLVLVSALFTGATVVAAAVAAVAVLLITDQQLSWLLGDSATGALAVFPYATLATAMLGLAMGPGLALRALGLVSRAFRSKLISLPLAAAAVVVGTVIADGAGSQVGLAIGEFARATINWTEVAMKLRRRGVESDG